METRIERFEWTVKIVRVHGGCPGTGTDEGRDYLRKALTSRRYALTQGCPNGETHPLDGYSYGRGNAEN
ncbi:hypothetical protein GCM10017782_30610 [Deinococcus ficus]|nr:hypothetical protein GCM10017782_30610 [Deinococcus ficus]